MIGTNIGKYSIIDYIGGGSFGNVYLAKDNALNAIKAIKLIEASNPSEVVKTIEEAQLLYMCKHKNIVDINEANVVKVNNISYVLIDMEYIKNGSFEKIIKDREVSLYEIISIIIDCLFALEHAHYYNVIHRDIKPANILLKFNSAKVSDFGLATALGNNYIASPQGYIAHLAPEVIEQGYTSKLTDIYALGITLLRACNYDSAWYQNNQKNYYAPYIPQKLKLIISKACNSDERSRYQTALEFRNQLSKLNVRIDWKVIDKEYFFGRMCNDVYTIKIIFTKSLYRVEFKKNGRRVKVDCREFFEENDAYAYMYEYVSNTLFY